MHRKQHRHFTSTQHAARNTQHATRNTQEQAMPAQPSEHAQPVEGERKEESKNTPPKDKSRPEDGRDYWRAGQQEDLSAGDEGVDDPTLEDFRDDLNEAREADTEEDLDAGPPGFADDVELPESVAKDKRRNEINDKTR
jgi:hypothetical protein